MRLILLLACAAGLALSSGALAAEPLSARLSGNTPTVTQHGPAGGLVGISRVRLSPDGGYVSDNTVGQTLKGTWRATDSAVCLTATEPPTPPPLHKENCLEVGGPDRWTVRNPRGGTLRYEIVAGHPDTPLKPVLPDVR